MVWLVMIVSCFVMTPLGKDPDEAIKKREEEEKRAKSFRENHMACAHDRSAERKVMEMAIEDKLSACRDFRRRGNLFHAEGQYRRGALQYRQASHLYPIADSPAALIYYDFCFPDDESQQQELDDIQQACLLNSAACFLACGELDETLDCCYQASRCRQPDNVKALYRRAVVYRLRDQFKEASVDLGKALAQRPNEIMLRKESAVLKSKIASYRERRKAMGANIFVKDQGQDPYATSLMSNGQALPSNVLLGSSVPAHPHGGDTTSGAIDETKNHDDIHSFQNRARRGQSEGGYTVATRDAGDGFGGGDEEGRRRHDLTLPVCVDVMQLEAVAGCALSLSLSLSDEVRGAGGD
ncbi:unnamed protein product [Scytosiphon promiscuus]